MKKVAWMLVAFHLVSFLRGQKVEECQDYLSPQVPEAGLMVVGAEHERYRSHFYLRDLIYLNRGSEQGVQTGAVYSVIRPGRQVYSPRKGPLGFYVSYVGKVQVVRSESNHSIAQILQVCSPVFLGDILLPPIENPPVERVNQKLERPVVSSGKATGYLVAGHSFLTHLAQGHLAFIDLGSNDGVAPAQRLTVFRPLEGFGAGGPFRPEGLYPVYGGMETQIFRRQRDRTIREAIVPMRALGEVTVLSVREGSALVVITQSTNEIFPGDIVELR